MSDGPLLVRLLVPYSTERANGTNRRLSWETPSSHQDLGRFRVLLVATLLLLTCSGCSPRRVTRPIRTCTL
jgi:hypothetical protein